MAPYHAQSTVIRVQVAVQYTRKLRPLSPSNYWFCGLASLCHDCIIQGTISCFFLSTLCWAHHVPQACGRTSTVTKHSILFGSHVGEDANFPGMIFFVLFNKKIKPQMFSSTQLLPVWFDPNSTARIESESRACRPGAELQFRTPRYLGPL